MKIKICGLTGQQDIEYANTLKPDYVGFVLAPSKRRISPEKCRELAGKLDDEIASVGVFVNTPAEEINHIMDFTGLRIAQVHGEETPEECKKIEKQVWKSFRIKDKKSIEQMALYDVDGYLLDAYNPEKYGGTGERFQWDLIKNMPLPPMTILAGGIHIDNIREGMKLPGIQCIDVSSGVESIGVKDFKKMKRIIERVRMDEK